MPVHASPPDCLDASLPCVCKLGPRFGSSLEINQSRPIVPRPDVCYLAEAEIRPLGLAPNSGHHSRPISTVFRSWSEPTFGAPALHVRSERAHRTSCRPRRGRFMTRFLSLATSALKAILRAWRAL